MKLANKIMHEIKKIKWSITSPKYKYSNESVKWIKSNLSKLRKEVAKKHKFEKEPNNSKMMTKGDRFQDNDRPLVVLQGNLKEDEFKKDQKGYLVDVLEYLAEMDFYYEFEKEY